MAKRLILFVFKAAISVTLFLVLFHPQWFWLPPDIFKQVSPGQMLEEIRNAGASHVAFWLTFAALARLAGMLAGVLRWQILLRGQGLRIPLGYLTRSWFVGRYFGMFFPGTLGLDGYRLLDSSLHTGEVIKCTTVIGIEKLIGFISLTLLVFLTFPLGFKLLKMNPVLFAAMLVVLATMVAVSFLLLLNPRVIQVLAAALPTPGVIRSKVNKLGAAVTAYSGSRADLLLSVFFGLLVHLGACFMYFGTMMAIWAQHTTLLDILFASPILIYATVLAPVVGGMGVRELVFVALLGSTSGAASAATFAHLGWWVGDMTPFLVGWALFVFKPVRTKAESQKRWAEMRAQALETDETLHLAPEQIRVYRERLMDYALCGVLGGLIAGALIGFGEAKWLAGRSAEFTELGVLCWGPLVYGVIFAGVGLGLAACAAFLSLLLDRFVSRAWMFAWSLGKILGLGALGIGGFRYWRDVLTEHKPTAEQLAALVGTAAAIGLVGMLVSGFVVSRFTVSRVKAVCAAAVAYLLIVSTGGALAKSTAIHPTRLPFSPTQKASGPNIIFVGIDTLRADYLKIFNPSARANTPNMEALAKDAVVYRKCFSQASWTKPSFATMFTGRYPSSHTVTTQNSAIPNELTTLADALLAGGYYTQGYSNNGNIARAWNFQKGFVDYEDLVPNTCFWAPESAISLTLYQGLRKARARVFKATVVTDYYQPGEVVNARAFSFLDGAEKPKDNPFYLFLHYMDCHDPYMDHQHPGVAYARAAMEHPDPEKYTDLFKEVYTGDVEYLDARLGELFDGLRKRGLYDNSIIVVTGDHGEEFYEHQGWWHGKTLYDEQTHVPLLIKLPGNVHGENENFARHLDLAPTLLSLAKLSSVEGMQGISLIAGAGEQPNESTLYVYSENDFEGNEVQAFRTHEYKYIRANEDNERKLKPVELYDMTADPGEMSNLAGGGAPVEAELGKQLADMMAYTLGHAAAPVMVQSSEELREQLGGIGYMQH